MIVESSISRGDEIICVSDKAEDFRESTTRITIGRYYKCVAIWQSHNTVFVSFYDDNNCYRNFNINKFIKSGENFKQKRFQMLLVR